MARTRLASFAQRAAHRTYHLWERLGVHVTPVTFDSPIPATVDLTDELFARRYSCGGVDWNLDEQRRLLRDVFPRFVAEREFRSNPGLSVADAAVLYSMVRNHQPRVMIEAGSGYSTTFAADALKRNAEEGVTCEYTAYEPYPPPVVRDGIDGLTKLVARPIQDVEPSAFDDVDLLFIDSSHVAAIGSDVNHLVLEVLPRLKPGALVHFHDIVLPGEYWPEWVRDRHHFWSEQYLVLAFLQHNRAFRVLWAAHYMQLEHPDEVRAVLPFFDPAGHRITSLWLQRSDG